MWLKGKIEWFKEKKTSGLREKLAQRSRLRNKLFKKKKWFKDKKWFKVRCGLRIKKNGLRKKWLKEKTVV